MRAPKVVDFYTAAWPDFTPALTVALGPLVQIFAPIGVLQAIGVLAGSVMMVTRRTKLLRGLGIYNTAIYVGSILAGLPWGLAGVTISYCIGYSVLIFTPTLWLSLRPLGVSAVRYCLAIMPLWVAGALAVLAAEMFVPMLELEVGWLRLGSSLVIFIAAYLALAILLTPRVVKRIFTLDFFEANRPVEEGA